MNHHVYNIYII